MLEDAISLPKIYCRVTLDGNTPQYELMSAQMKVKDATFFELTDLISYMADLLSEKSAGYTIDIEGRDFHLTWPQLHGCLEQLAGAARFEGITL